MIKQTEKAAHQPVLNNLVKTLRRHFIIFASTGCYVGYSPVASGTFGTGVGVVIFVLFFNKLSIPYYVINFLILLFIGFWVSGEAEVIFEEKDSGKIVIDEILGYLVTMFLIPQTLKNIIIAFLLFRLLDIIKLFPAKVIEERVAGGYGVVLDDVMVGVYANLIMQSIVFSPTYLATIISLTKV